MQKHPNMSLVQFFCLHNPRAFRLCDRNGRSALRLVAMFSESFELLQSMLEIEHMATNKRLPNLPETALGELCRRPEFPYFKEMLTSFIEVDSSADIICDGILGLFLLSEEIAESYEDNYLDLVVKGYLNSLRFF